MRKQVLLSIVIIIISMLLSANVYAKEKMVETDLFTVSGEKIYERLTYIEDDIAIPYYYTEDGTNIVEFIEYDVNGKKILQYRTIDEEQPTYSVNLVSLLQKLEIANDISGTEVTIPECSFDPMETEDQRANPDNYEFKCWRFENGRELRFYYPGDTIMIPNKDITLYAIFVEKGTETTIPDKHIIIFESNDESNSTIESIEIYTGTPIEIPDNIFARDGYTFSCWTDGTNYYNVGDTLIMPDHDVTLTAVWIKNTDTPDDTTPSTPSYFFPIINQLATKTEPKTDTTTSTPSNTYVCPYKDISGHWAEDIIKYISEIGLIDGITSTEFQPNEPMTREMFVTAVARLSGIESNHVNWAIDNGILLGYGNGEYGLTDTVTREQMAVFFIRFFEKMGIDTSKLWTKDAFAFADDESISDWATDAVYEIQKIGLIQGKENNLFDPKGTATRAEGATVLYNLIRVIMEKN